MLLPNRLYRLGQTSSFFLLAWLVVCPLSAQDSKEDLYRDPHYREELGINEFTAPSIEKLFGILDNLRPIPASELIRIPQPVRIDNRIQLALSFGTLIAEGFLAVEAENAAAIHLLGHELLGRAKGLGVETRLTRHSKQLLALADKGMWNVLRNELIIAQNDVERAMLDLRDEELAHFLGLGGWIRGLDVAAACVARDFTPERASELNQSDVLDYYLSWLTALAPMTQSSHLIAKIIGNLKEIRQKLALQPSAVQIMSAVQVEANELVELINSDTSRPTNG
ncbi:MAG: hypothetical protein JO076_10680 [Verrucomicrobia bacterium]|nr:hypothetical protein [Verrucomicrobiota bacterium]